MKAKTQREKSAEKFSRDQKRVLLISDEPGVSFLSSLDSAGLKVVGVSDAAAAPISLRRARPQLVIASTAIRKLSTGELARMLNQSQDGLPLILMGAEAATLARRQEAMLAGAFDYFQIPAEIELLTLCANQLVAMRQRLDQLRGEADLDHLTGLANRRRFRVALSREVERWRRYSVPCALLLLDIDHMKTINDTYGHPSGDLVERLLTRCVESLVITTLPRD